jgi:hypothetical protein
MAMSHQLMGTGSGDTLNFEGKVDVFEHTMVTVGIQMLNQFYGVLGIAVIADGRDLGDGFYRVRGCLDQCYIHWLIPFFHL